MCQIRNTNPLKILLKTGGIFPKKMVSLQLEPFRKGMDVKII